MDSVQGRPSITTKMKRLESKVISLFIEKVWRQQLAGRAPEAFLATWYFSGLFWQTRRPEMPL